MPEKNTNIAALAKKQFVAANLRQCGTVEDLISTVVAIVAREHERICVSAMQTRKFRIDYEALSAISNWDAQLAAKAASQIREMFLPVIDNKKTDFRRRQSISRKCRAMR